jgi:hypothetical protein
LTIEWWQEMAAAQQQLQVERIQQHPGPVQAQRS